MRRLVSVGATPVPPHPAVHVAATGADERRRGRPRRSGQSLRLPPSGGVARTRTRFAGARFAAEWLGMPACVSRPRSGEPLDRRTDRGVGAPRLRLPRPTLRGGEQRVAPAVLRHAEATGVDPRVPGVAQIRRASSGSAARDRIGRRRDSWDVLHQDRAGTRGAHEPPELVEQRRVRPLAKSSSAALLAERLAGSAASEEPLAAGHVRDEVAQGLGFNGLHVGGEELRFGGCWGHGSWPRPPSASSPATTSHPPGAARGSGPPAPQNGSMAFMVEPPTGQAGPSRRSRACPGGRRHSDMPTRRLRGRTVSGGHALGPPRSVERPEQASSPLPPAPPSIWARSA